MNGPNLKPMIEAILMAADEPVGVDRLLKLMEEGAFEACSKNQVREAITELQIDCAERGVELVEVASGFRFQARADYSDYIARLWTERRPRYSRALLETLSIIAYRQPITRGEIEHIRGVSIASTIMRTVLEREWVRVVGHRDVPGRPALYATTKQFLDYFGLQSLDALPSLAELKDVDDLNQDLFGQSSVGSENESEGGTVIADKEQMDTETNEVAQVVAAASEADLNEPGGDGQTSALHQTDPTHTES